MKKAPKLRSKRESSTQAAGTPAKSARLENPTASQAVASLQEMGCSTRAKSFLSFIQAVPGGYGEGDQCLGVTVPEQRKVAALYAALPQEELALLLRSPWHECRLTAVFIMVRRYEVAARRHLRDGKQANLRGKLLDGQETPQEMVKFYLANLEGLNNWDLVDSSAHKILGAYLVDRPKERKILTRLAKTGDLWQERIAVIATLSLIKNDEFDELLHLSTRFLHHPHDLMHKAVGWMLREMGKRNLELLRGFLSEHAGEMPRTMLRL